MTTTTQPIDLSQLTSAELKAALLEREKSEGKAKEKAKQDYEADRDRIVKFLVGIAKEIHEQLTDFKKSCHATFDTFREQSQEYGDIRTNSKGGFSLRTSDGKLLARLERNVVHEYDERADLALGLIKEFLESTIKKKDASTYRLISKLIERNKSGDLKPERVASFLSIKNNYTDERWTKAMTLLEESYREREVSYNVSFYEKDDLGKDQPIILTFASL